MKECVVVLGMHRSGTSVLAGMVSLQGYYLGANALPSQPDNPKGFFENNEIYRLNQSIFKSQNTSWDDYFFTIDKINPNDLQRYKAQAKEIIKKEFGLAKRIFIKDPRICLLFPFWQSVLEDMGFNIKVIFVYRSPMEVAVSLKSRNDFVLQKSLLLWSHYCFQAERSSRKFDRLIVQYARDFHDLDSFLISLADFLDIDVTEKMVKDANDFYTPKLKHHQVDMGNFSGETPVYLKDFIKILQKGDLDQPDKLDKIFDEFYWSQELFMYDDLFLRDHIKNSEITNSNLNSEKEKVENKLIAFEENNRISELTIRDLQSEKAALENQKLQIEEGMKHIKNTLTELKKMTFTNYSSTKTNSIMPPLNLVDIIIPVYNALEYTEHCINSLLASDEGLIREIIIVNDGSDIETTSYLRLVAKENSIIKLIDLECNQGYTKAVNTGLSDSSAEYVVLLNSDTIVSRNWLEKMIQCAQSNKKIGIVGPLSNAASWQSVPALLDQDGKFNINELPEGFSVDRMAELVESVSICAYPEVPFVNGFCFLIKREVIDEIGLMDEENFPIGYGEENDYCIRAQDAGFVLSIADNAYVYHAKSKSFGHSQRTKLSAKGSQSLKEKHGKEKFDRLVKSIKNIKILDAARSSIEAALKTNQLKQRINPKDISILFVLPKPGPGGGSHSIVQEVAGMRALGVNAAVAVEKHKLSELYRRYKEINNVEKIFVGYERNSIIHQARDYDVVVATIYHSTSIVKSICDVHPYILPAYYVQDYEPLFFEEGTSSWEEAKSSYALINNMLHIAKTNWIAKEVALHHGVSVRKVVPSIDHAVYHPSLTKNHERGVICVAAMIRPHTPRRGAQRTMRLLSKIKRQYKDKIDIQIFGCNETDPSFNNLKQDFEFNNQGVLDRTGVASCLQAADIFIDLSDYQAFGRTSLEAMACGCTAMLPCYGGGDEYAIDGYNALVVDPFDENECHSRLVELIDNPDQLRKMQKTGIKTASSYSPQKAALSELELMVEYLAVHRKKYAKKDKPTLCVMPVTHPNNKPKGSGFVRLIQPYVNNPSMMKKWDIVTLEKGRLPTVSMGDIAIIQRDAAGLELGEIVNWLISWRGAGKKVIFELDDDLLDAEGLYKRTGTNKKKIKKLVSMITKITSLADAVIVSTPQLFQLVSSYNKKVFLIPNYLDPILWNISGNVPNRLSRNDRNDEIVKIGYIGTPTHDADLALLKDAMNKIKAEYKGKIHIEVVGGFEKYLDKPMFGKAIALPKDQSYPNFVEWLKVKVDWDIAVIPLVDDRFNRSKSNLKFLECSALGLASICSDVPSYSSTVRHGVDGLLVDNNTEDWYKAIKLLIDDAELRKNLSNNAFKTLSENYTTHVNSELYNSVLSEVDKLPIKTENPSLLKTVHKRKGYLSVVGIWNNYIESDSRRQRLYSKFKSNPYRYFADSRHMTLRPIRFLFKRID